MVRHVLRLLRPVAGDKLILTKSRLLTCGNGASGQLGGQVGGERCPCQAMRRCVGSQWALRPLLQAGSLLEICRAIAAMSRDYEEFMALRSASLHV